MSWSISVGPLAYPEIEDAMLDATIPESQGPDTPERQEQLHSAKLAAIDILRRMTTDRKTKLYVSLNGHYAQSVGWTPAQSVGASVSVVQEQVPTPEEPKHEAEA